MHEALTIATATVSPRFPFSLLVGTAEGTEERVIAAKCQRRLLAGEVYGKLPPRLPRSTHGAKKQNGATGYLTQAGARK